VLGALGSLWHATFSASRIDIVLFLRERYFSVCSKSRKPARPVPLQFILQKFL
jgi:hypothetical protein